MPGPDVARARRRAALIACFGAVALGAGACAAAPPQGGSVAPVAVVVASASAGVAASDDAAARVPLAARPFAPVLGADGAPSTTAMKVSPVIGATLFLAAGYPSWRIGKLEGDAIAWGALPVTGLPEMQAWDALVGRFPDLLWLKIDVGFSEFYRWQPSAGSWSLDRSLEGRRRTGIEILPWTGGALLVVRTDPESVLGEPATTILTTLPGGGAPALPPLPRPDVGLVATTPSGELIATYGAPAEVIVLAPGGVTRHLVPGGKEGWVSGLVVRSSTEIHVAVTECTPALQSFDGARWTPMESPATAPVVDLVATADATLWLLDGSGALFRRPRGGGWESVPLPAVAEPAVELVVSEDQRRLWLRLRSASGDDEGLFLTQGAARERP